MKKRKNRKKGKPVTVNDTNFVTVAGPGCHMARPGHDEWTIEWESVDPTDYDDEIPDLAIDPVEQTLTLCNIQDEHVVAYITVYDLTLRDKKQRILRAGNTTDSNGNEMAATTLIILCPPTTFAHLCYIDCPSSLEDLKMDSDVQVWNQHPNPSDQHPAILQFPLQGGPFLCTQGVGGHLTHFFAGNLHAIDFRCPIGTPLLAVANGTVRQVKQDCQVTGIAVSNLFTWNSILIELDTNDALSESAPEPLFCEYVHVNKAVVSEGDRVEAGQIIGESGSIGFSPEPHLHFAAYRSSDATAPTVQARFSGAGGPYIPVGGKKYDQTGLVE